MTDAPEVETVTMGTPRDLRPDELDALHHANQATTNGHRPTSAAPNDRAAEDGYLGALILWTAETDTLLTHLDAADHYWPPNQRIHHAIAQMRCAGHPVDPVTVAHHLGPANLASIGGPSTLLHLQSHAAGPTEAHHHATIVAAHARARRLLTGIDSARAALLAGDHPTAHNLLATLDQHTAAVGPVEWEDVGAVLRGDYKPLVRAFLERSDGEALIYPGLLHWLFSVPGIGKTWVALQAAAEAIAAGIPVVYLDWEGNRRLVGLRLQALGITDDEVDDAFHYLRPGALDSARGHQLGEWAEHEGVGLVIFDGFAKALAACGHDEDKSGPVLTYLDAAVDPFSRQGDGAAVLLLDHVTKDKETRGLWPRGSGAKQGEVSGAAWLLRPRRSFNRETSGVLELVQAKDREGEVGIDGQVVATVHVDPDPDTGRVAIRLDPPTKATTDSGAPRRTIYMERVSRWIEGENRYGRHPSTTDITKGDGIRGRKEYRAEGLATLIEEGHVEVDLSGKTHGHVVVRPYREDDELGIVDADREDEVA